jgi:hypothetical protein
LLIDQVESVHADFSAVDLYFFQYHSVWAWIQTSSNALQTFLTTLLPEIDLQQFIIDLGPVSVPQENKAQEISQLVSPFPENRCYERVTLVGHSEGGVVIRKMVLAELSNPAVLACRLALFAPAIAGFKPAGLLGVLAKFPGLGAILNGIMYASPAYQGLNDTKKLERLRADTEQSHAKGRALCADILWGDEDYVVEPEKYDCDVEEFVHFNHTLICKPSEDNLKPVDHVKKWPQEKQSTETPKPEHK